MGKKAEAVSIIGGADGPTSVFVVKKNAKLNIKQKIAKWKYNRKKAYIERTLKPESHTIDEVMEYLVNKYGFVELDADSDEVREEYQQMRASFIIQYAPELMGEYATIPSLKSESPEDVQAHLALVQERMQKASELPTSMFDIDFHKFIKRFDDINDNIHIVIEKKYAHIGGGACGSKKVVKEFNRIYKEIFRYYGVTKEDIRQKTERYKDVVRALSR